MEEIHVETHTSIFMYNMNAMVSFSLNLSVTCEINVQYVDMHVHRPQCVYVCTNVTYIYLFINVMSLTNQLLVDIPKKHVLTCIPCI